LIGLKPFVYKKLSCISTILSNSANAMSFFDVQNGSRLEFQCPAVQTVSASRDCREVLPVACTICHWHTMWWTLTARSRAPIPAIGRFSAGFIGFDETAFCLCELALRSLSEPGLREAPFPSSRQLDGFEGTSEGKLLSDFRVELSTPERNTRREPH
jgi:hypothetical protein